MRLLFLSSGPHVPSARFRILPYQRHFRAEGHQTHVWHSFPEKYDYFPWLGFRPSQLLKRGVRWWHLLRSRLMRFDAVMIDREIFDAPGTELEQRFRESCRKLVMDFDDAVFLRYPGKFEQLLALADLVICGNRFLVEKTLPLNSRVCHLPTCVDLDDYAASSRAAAADMPHSSGRLVLGWMGTTGNLRYLTVAAEALRELARERDFELRVVVPDATPLQQIDLRGVRVVHEVWQPQREVEQLRAFDIGLMPLFPNQEWDRYKCGLKLIQYLAVGIPGVAAPVGVNSEILDHNQNGFAAQTPAEWLTALRALTGDAELRRRMGLRGLETVRQRYSIQACYPALRNALLNLTSNTADAEKSAPIFRS